MYLTSDIYTNTQTAKEQLADSSSWYDFLHKYWAIEIKVGYTSLSTFVKDQLKKDNYLFLNNNEVERVSWHLLGKAASPSESFDIAIREYDFIGSPVF
ncbi:MAG: hypothetical protein ACKE51_08490 [Methylococcaceae bacterium]